MFAFLNVSKGCCGEGLVACPRRGAGVFVGAQIAFNHGGDSQRLRQGGRKRHCARRRARDSRPSGVRSLPGARPGVACCKRQGWLRVLHGSESLAWKARAVGRPRVPLRPI